MPFFKNFYLCALTNLKSMTYLDFEKPIQDIETELIKLKEVASKSKVDLTDKIKELEMQGLSLWSRDSFLSIASDQTLKHRTLQDQGRIRSSATGCKKMPPTLVSNRIASNCAVFLI